MCYVMCMKKRRKGKENDKIRTDVKLSIGIFNMAIDYNINLSAFLENKLVEYFLQRQKLNSMYCVASDTKPYTRQTHGQQKQPTKIQHVKVPPHRRSAGAGI